MRHLNSIVVILCLLGTAWAQVTPSLVLPEEPHAHDPDLSMGSDHIRSSWDNSLSIGRSSRQLPSNHALSEAKVNTTFDENTSIPSSAKASTLINLTALRAFLKRAKLPDGGFEVQPIEQGLPQSDTWAAFLVPWTCDFAGLREIAFDYLATPLDYFGQLTTRTSGFRNNTLSSTVTVFATALALMTYHRYAPELLDFESYPWNMALDFLLEAELPTGGFEEVNKPANLFTTTLAVQTLTLLDHELKNRFVTQAFIQQYYNKAGGFFDDPNLDQSLVWETFLGVWATLLLAPRTPFPEVINYLLKVQQSDGSWGTLQETFAAIAILERLDQLTKLNQTQILEFVARCQVVENQSTVLDGGFKAAPTAANETVSTVNTAYALYLLHVLGGIAADVMYTVSTDQAYYIQGELVSVYTEAYYGDESLETLNMSFTLASASPVIHWSGYDQDVGAYWQQFDTSSLFALQTIVVFASWEPTFLSRQVQAHAQEEIFVVGYEIAIDVETTTVEPGQNTSYTVTVSTTETSVSYPVAIQVTGPDYREENNLTTMANGTALSFNMPSDILLGDYIITATLSIPETNMTRTAQATIEVETVIEVEVAGLEQSYAVGDPFELTVHSWYNSSKTFPRIPLTIEFDYHGVVVWETESIYGVGGEYHVNTTIPVEPILGEVMVSGVLHFPEFTYEEELGTTFVQFALTVDQVQMPEVAYLARPFHVSYMASSIQVSPENLTDFRSYVNLTSVEPVKNHTFSRQIATRYQHGQYVLNWTIDPNLPEVAYNLTIWFENPFGETIPAYQTTVRVESQFQLWVPPDFSRQLKPGEHVQLDFALYWTDDPNKINLRGGAIAGLNLEATSALFERKPTPISLTTLILGSHTMPGYGLHFIVPEDVSEGSYQIFIQKSQTGELVETVEVQVTLPPVQQPYRWIGLTFIGVVVGLGLLFIYMGVQQWRWERPEREARRQEAYEEYMIEEWKDKLRIVDHKIQNIFKDPLLEGWPRNPDALQKRLQRFETHPIIRGYVGLERERQNLRETIHQRLEAMKEAMKVLLTEKRLSRKISQTHRKQLRAFQKNPTEFIEQEGLHKYSSLVTVVQQIMMEHPPEEQEQTPCTQALQLFTGHALNELITMEDGIKKLQRDMDILRTSEECEAEIARYLELKQLITKILQLHEERKRYSQEHLKLQQKRKTQTT